MLMAFVHESRDRGERIGGNLIYQHFAEEVRSSVQIMASKTTAANEYTAPCSFLAFMARPVGEAPQSQGRRSCQQPQKGKSDNASEPPGYGRSTSHN